VLAVGQPDRSGQRDHRAVVGAEIQPREVGAETVLVAGGSQFGAQAAIGAHAAGDHQPRGAGHLQRAATLDHQRVDDRLLEGQRDVGAGLLALIAGLPGQQHLGLQARKAEIQAGAIGHRAGEAERARSALPGQRRQRRAAGIRQPHQLGGLVERLAGGVVQGVAENAVLTDAGHLHQHRMAAGNQQRHERRLGRIGFQQRRQQVAFHVVHADRRHAQRPGHRPRRRGTHQQRARQTRTGGIGDAAEIGRGQPGLGQGLAHQRQQLAHVVAAGQLGHHAAVVRVQLDLAVQGVGQQALAGRLRLPAQQGHAGLVAGGLDAEHRAGDGVPRSHL